MINIIKRGLRAFLGPAYVPLLDRIKYHLCKLRGAYFAGNDLDKKLKKYIDYPNGFFVELGANNGITQSNTLHFELKQGWRGVLVEPSLHNFLTCKQNRNEENHVFCNACVSFEYSNKYVDIQYADLMTVSQSLDLDLPDLEEHLRKGKQELKKHEDIYSFGALAAPLSELLDRANAPELIDLLSLDVEGAELEVLRGIDFSKYKFKYMLIEVRELSKVEHFLKPYGYEVIDKLSGHDYLFAHK